MKTNDVILLIVIVFLGGSCLGGQGFDDGTGGISGTDGDNGTQGWDDGTGGNDNTQGWDDGTGGNDNTQGWDDGTGGSDSTQGPDTIMPGVPTTCAQLPRDFAGLGLVDCQPDGTVPYSTGEWGKPGDESLGGQPVLQFKYEANGTEHKIRLAATNIVQFDIEGDLVGLRELYWPNGYNESITAAQRKGEGFSDPPMPSEGWTCPPPPDGGDEPPAQPDDFLGYTFFGYVTGWYASDETDGNYTPKELYVNFGTSMKLPNWIGLEKYPDDKEHWQRFYRELIAHENLHIIAYIRAVLNYYHLMSDPGTRFTDEDDCSNRYEAFNVLIDCWANHHTSTLDQYTDHGPLL